MKKKKSVFKSKTPILFLLLSAIFVIGCSNKESGSLVSGTVYEETNEADSQSAQSNEDTNFVGIVYPFDEEVSAMEYIEKAEIKDYLMGDRKFVIYAPKDRGFSSGKVYYNEHSISYKAKGIALQSNDELYLEFENAVNDYLATVEQLSDYYSNVQISEVLEEASNRYQFISSATTDGFGNSYPINAVIYLDMQAEGAGVIWQLEMNGQYADDITNLLISELATCYNLDEYKLIYDKLLYDASLIIDESSYQDEYVVRDGDIELQKVDGYQYLGSSQLLTDDEQTVCEVLTPMGEFTYANQDYTSSYMHGVNTRASIIGLAPKNLKETMQYFQESTYENRVKNNYGNVVMGDIISAKNKENAYYCIITYDEASFSDDMWYPSVSIEYLKGITESHALYYEIILKTEKYDKYTDILIKELEMAYGIDLSQFYDESITQVTGKTNAQITSDRIVANTQNKADSNLDETILWFNATYAPLSYSNDGDWRLIGGWEDTQENKDMTSALLLFDWEVYDKKSALDTINNLKKSGHRQKWQEYEDELRELGLLSLDEVSFAEKFIETGIEENAIRYLIVYEMYHQGISSDDIAAWDLCRVNQLYADAYVCGYLSYEEAMDGSLQNSLILQKKFASWEEMIDSYMLGYQFWQNDLCITDDSPTLERWACYEELNAMEGGPYTLDWDMTLAKCW